jgi:hypothetical protein
MNNAALSKALRSLAPKSQTLSFETHEECVVAASGPKTKEGSPALKAQGKRIYVQEVQWKLHNKGKIIPKGKTISETCQTRGCLNPEHLAAMSLKEIIRARGKHKSGSANGRAKLTEAEVAIIKNSPKAGIRDLARHFGVDPTTIQDIRRGINWAGLVVPKGTRVFTPPPPPPPSKEELAEAREKEMSWLCSSKYPREEKLEKLGLRTEAAFLDLVLPKTRPMSIWETRPRSFWEDPSATRTPDKLGLTAGDINNLIGCAIINTAGILNASSGRVPKTEGHPEGDWREALLRPRVMSEDPAWRTLISHLRAQGSQQEARALWETWLTEGQREKIQGLKKAAKAKIQRAEAQLRSTLTDKKRQWRTADKTEAPYRPHFHHHAEDWLYKRGMKTPPEIALSSAQEIMGTSGFGIKSLGNLVWFLTEHGQRLREEPHEMELLESSREHWLSEEKAWISLAFAEVFNESCAWWENPRRYEPEQCYEKIRKLYNLTSGDLSAWSCREAQKALTEWEKNS